MILKRIIEPSLIDWKATPYRKPLLVRGARQVGKTYSIEEFGHEHFNYLVKIDLERNREWHRVFEGDLEVKKICAELEVLTNQTIVPGESLLFLDEIQSCPRAIMALRYFHEELPDLHVISAGSLLEFAIADIPFPVGRIQFLEMHPMVFAEFLWATGQDKLAEIVLGVPAVVPDSVHHLLMSELKKYCFIGGMPETVARYVEMASIQQAAQVVGDLCETYRHDFSKYSRRADPDCIDSVFRSLARNLSHQVKYSRLSDAWAPTTVKRAVNLLNKARVIKRVPSASPSGLPLGASASDRKFKTIIVDIGIWQHLSGMRIDTAYAENDLMAIYRGAMAEQFVGQEMMVSQGSDLYYWAREARGSSAEVDYLAVVRDSIFGVEVKSGPAGRLRSMHMLLQTYQNCAGGMVFSAGPYSELPEQRLTFIPLYFVYAATRSVT